METKEGEQRQANRTQIGRNHIHLAVGEVDHANNAVHHGVADGDQAIHRAKGQAVNQLLQEEYIHNKQSHLMGEPQVQHHAAQRGLRNGSAIRTDPLIFTSELVIFAFVIPLVDHVV
ncbi:Uncharacterised protein [Serratia fonticola]|uniref:Uncharacterized protein n=1 Tax=Serratia fonticola TaxID=47917 RepID=A0A4U9TPT4_SERFO|nr:Uncharacterised protein [Serratia fonticola]